MRGVAHGLGVGEAHGRLSSPRPGAAARATVDGHVTVDGFFTLSDAETGLILALGERTSVTITLPDWPGSQAVRKTLLSAGFEEQSLSSTVRSAGRTGFNLTNIGSNCNICNSSIFCFA